MMAGKYGKKNALGRAILRDLHDRGLTQKHLADSIGTSKYILYQVFVGNRRMTPGLAIKMSKYVGISSEKLIEMQTKIDHEKSIKELRCEEELEREKEYE